MQFNKATAAWWGFILKLTGLMHFIFKTRQSFWGWAPWLIFSWISGQSVMSSWFRFSVYDVFLFFFFRVVLFVYSPKSFNSYTFRGGLDSILERCWAVTMVILCFLCSLKRIGSPIQQMLQISCSCLEMVSLLYIFLED